MIIASSADRGVLARRAVDERAADLLAHRVGAGCHGPGRGGTAGRDGRCRWKEHRQESEPRSSAPVGEPPASRSPHPALRPSSHKERSGSHATSHAPEIRQTRHNGVRQTSLHAKRRMGGIAIAMPPIPSCSRSTYGAPVVREGGVEPPRPCGHWNLNPARLPIPPPAHWVCPPAPFLPARRLPTPRTLARPRGWIHIPSRRAPWSPPGAPPRGRARVWTDTRSRINLVPVPPVSPGAGRGPRPGAGHWSATASTILGRSTESALPQAFEEERHRELRQATARVGGSRRESTPADRADRGNQPIDRRVDTISKQYQVGSTQVSSTRTGRAQGGSGGGGAPWES